METCFHRVIEFLTNQQDIDGDPCGAYTTGGKICGLHKCNRPIRTIYIHGLSGKTSQIQMHKPLLSTIKDLKMCIKARMGIPLEHQRLLFGNKELEKDWGVLKDFGVENNSTIILVARLPGGTNRKPSTANKRYTGNEAGIKYSVESDCITGNSTSGVLRGRMSCGHTVEAGSLLRYALSELEGGRFVLLCPAIVCERPLTMCRKEWAYPEIRKMALLTAQERQFFEEVLGENTASAVLDAKVCPQCSSLVERPNPHNNRIVCLICSMRAKTKLHLSSFMGFASTAVTRKCFVSAFCWKCMQPWRGHPSGGKYCGNSDCNWEIVELLTETPTKELNGCLQVPTTRACPACGLLIQHLSGCRHVTCRRCSTPFCFVCLRERCGSEKTCTVALRQSSGPPLIREGEKAS